MYDNKKTDKSIGFFLIKFKNRGLTDCVGKKIIF